MEHLTTGNSSNIRFFNKKGRQLYNLWNEVKDCILYTYAYYTYDVESFLNNDTANESIRWDVVITHGKETMMIISYHPEVVTQDQIVRIGKMAWLAWQ